MAITPIFESEPCGRCGGSGNYSFNLMDGTRCFGCGGRGVRLTKRGAAAQKYFHELLAVPVADVKIGDKFRIDIGITSRKIVTGTVVDISEDTLNPGRGPVVEFTYGEADARHAYHTLLDSTFRRLRTQSDIDAALAYQGTLTKQGKPAKR